MKKNLLFSVLGILFLAFLFFDASSGAGSAQNADRTGSPIASGNCGNCHNGGNFNSSVAVELLDGEEVVTTYQPGQLYTFKVTVSASNNPAGYGFQAVALQGTDNLNAGTFGDAPSGTKVSMVDDRNYFEHSERSTANSWSIPWTAPEAGTGDVSIYAAGNAVNGAAGSGGDTPTTLATPLVLTEASTSASYALQTLDLEMKVFPNPVTDILNLELNSTEQGNFQLQLFNTTGQLMLSKSIEVNMGNNTERMNVGNLPQGHYFLHLGDGKRGQTMGILKQ